MSGRPMVYVITSGQYSDYQIRAIFEDEAVAKDYADRHRSVWGSWHDTVEVEAWPLNAAGESPRSLFLIRWGIQDWDEPRVEESFGYSAAEGEYDGECIVVSARDPEHAVKIAAEKRAEQLADRGGIVA